MAAVVNYRLPTTVAAFTSRITGFGLKCGSTRQQRQSKSLTPSLINEAWLMELAIVIDLKTLEWSTDGSATGIVYWEVDGASFPETGWNDFIAVLFEWWLDAILRILRSEATTEKLRFFEGPFWIVVEKAEADLILRFVDGRYTDHTVREVHVAKEMLRQQFLTRRIVFAAVASLLG